MSRTAFWLYLINRTFATMCRRTLICQVFNILNNPWTNIPIELPSPSLTLETAIDRIISPEGPFCSCSGALDYISWSLRPLKTWFQILNSYLLLILKLEFSGERDSASLGLCGCALVIDQIWLTVTKQPTNFGQILVGAQRYVTEHRPLKSTEKNTLTDISLVKLPKLFRLGQKAFIHIYL